MNTEEIKRILDEKINELEKFAKNGFERIGFISGTTIVISCSPNKTSISWGIVTELDWLEDYVRKKGYVPGRHDGKSPHQRQFKKEFHVGIGG